MLTGLAHSSLFANSPRSHCRGKKFVGVHAPGGRHKNFSNPPGATRRGSTKSMTHLRHRCQVKPRFRGRISPAQRPREVHPKGAPPRGKWGPYRTTPRPRLRPNSAITLKETQETDNPIRTFTEGVDTSGGELAPLSQVVLSRDKCTLPAPTRRRQNITRQRHAATAKTPKRRE